MVVYPSNEWKLIGFRRSEKPDKKVVAILKFRQNIKEIHFGQRGSSTYHDLTKVGGDPVHNDPKKRENYRKRHKGEGDAEKKWSAGYLSYHYLW